MSRQLTLRPLAEADLRQIWDYTRAHWGEAQAETYLQGLGQLFIFLTENSEIARERVEIHPPVRLYPYQSHLVIFICNDSTLEVIRVVHNRSDWMDLLRD